MSSKLPRIEKTKAEYYSMYNLWFPPTLHPLWRELQMIERGGLWKKSDGEMAGNGLPFHYKEAIKILWPHIDQHRWFDLFLDQWLKHKYVAVLGPKSSGKTCCAAVCHLVDYYAFSGCTTVVVCSDTKENLEDRIWGEIKKLHRMAKMEFSWLPGQLIEGRCRIVTDQRDENSEGRDFRNGMVGVPVKKGNAVVGISSFVGRKNKRVRFCADELSLLPMSFIDATASQANPEVKVTGMGNPAQTTDALGALAEPDPSLGGWDSGIDQSPKTKTWKTRWPDGIAIQFPGSDCPNMDVPIDHPVPYPYLMTRKQMDEDAKIWGREDWHYTMFNEGRMPRGQGSRRVLTRQLCVKNHAMDEPLWHSPQRTKVASLDAAYRAVGGDRCVFAIFEFGREGTDSSNSEDRPDGIITQSIAEESKQVIIALKEISVIPIEGNDFESPEDQIVMYVKKACEVAGIPPRNFFFDSGMRTSLVTAFSRLWSIDVNPIDCGGRPSERKVSENIDVIASDYYSKKITELWYSWRLIVEAGQFRGMTEDVMKEGCQREWMTVGGNKIEVEPKHEMKCKCFVAGTMIKTPHGDVPIKNLKVGDIVSTPFGDTAIVKTHLNHASRLFTVRFSNGSFLTGTGGHEIFTWNFGWVRLDTLNLSSIVETVKNLPLWHLANGLCTKTMFTGFRQLADIIRGTETGRIQKRREFYTELSGLTTMALFLKVGMSIMLMGIGKITASIISAWSTLGCIKQSICESAGRIPMSENPTLNEYQTGSPSLKYGTDQKKAAHGTEKISSGFGQEGPRFPKYAKYAKSLLRHFMVGQDSVRATAQTNSFKTHTREKSVSVSCVARSILAIFTNHRRTVPNHVQCWIYGKPEEIFNLTLADHNCYYANGILVANCGRSPDLADCTVIGLEGARQRGFLIKRLANTEYIEQDTRWKDELRRKARAAAKHSQLNYAA